MGNYQEAEINKEELKPYLKKGLVMDDLVNLKKAFLSLDQDNTGKILYDVKKLEDIDKYQLPVADDNGKVLIDFDTFMKIMTENIIKNREKFGSQATLYESETSTVTCFFCPRMHSK